MMKHSERVLILLAAPGAAHADASGIKAPVILISNEMPDENIDQCNIQFNLWTRHNDEVATAYKVLSK